MTEEEYAIELQQMHFLSSWMNEEWGKLKNTHNTEHSAHSRSRFEWRREQRAAAIRACSHWWFYLHWFRLLGRKAVFAVWVREKKSFWLCTRHNQPSPTHCRREYVWVCAVGIWATRLDTVLVCWHYTYSLCAAGWLGMKEWKRKKCCMVDPKERDEEEKVAQHEDSKMSFLQAAEAKRKSSTSEADKHTHKLGRTRGRNYWKSFLCA